MWFVLLSLCLCSASGSSTVAIDNKIEQAMDLVKSHLMLAVREEVEVLKERIDELMERIALLESENSILRASASQVTCQLFPFLFLLFFLSFLPFYHFTILPF